MMFHGLSPSPGLDFSPSVTHDDAGASAMVVDAEEDADMFGFAVIVVELFKCNSLVWRQRAVDAQRRGGSFMPPRLYKSPLLPNVCATCNTPLPNEDQLQQLMLSGALLPRDLHMVALRIARSVARACAEAHWRGVAHFDIKADNVFVQWDLDPQSVDRAALGDFGSAVTLPFASVVAKYLTSFWTPASNTGMAQWLRARIGLLDAGAAGLGMIPTRTSRGTEIYQAPEMLKLSRNMDSEGAKYDRRLFYLATESVDVWALGSLVVELCSGKSLFDALSYLGLFDVSRSYEDAFLPNVCRKMSHTRPGPAAGALFFDQRRRMSAVMFLNRLDYAIEDDDLEEDTG